VRICPCCGFKSNSVLTRASSEGCQSCNARAVGEPLPRAEHELPSYGRSLLLAVTGTLMVLMFLTQTFIALTQRYSRGATSNLAFFSMIPFDPRSWLAAAETAAWQLKWVMMPVTVPVIYMSRKLYRSIVQSPSRFCGLRYARKGYMTSAAVPLLILILIGVTLPERLRQRQLSIRAGFNAQGYRIDRALLEYREEFGTLPSDLKDLSRLPDSDGSIAAALKDIDAGGYKASADMAAVPKQKPQQLRGAVIRNASLNTTSDELLGERLSFTNYELQLPGADKLLGTEDDLLVRDGVITKASETPRPGSSTTTSTQIRQP
jgi:hypothetical protein